MLSRLTTSGADLGWSSAWDGADGSANYGTSAVYLAEVLWWTFLVETRLFLPSRCPLEDVRAFDRDGQCVALLNRSANKSNPAVEKYRFFLGNSLSFFRFRSDQFPRIDGH